MTTDLNTPDHIAAFLRRFYDKVLADAHLAPIFVEGAGIDLPQHLAIIESYWCKMLLGAPGYDRHTMNIHRAVHQRHAFTAADFDRWLAYFEASLDEAHQGPCTDRARKVARSIAGNMKEALLAPGDYRRRTRDIADRAQLIRPPAGSADGASMG